MPHPNTVISVDDVSKRFVIRKDKSLKERLVNFGISRQHREDFYALRDVSLDIAAGSTVGLIGANGSGKSTLLKTIGGIIQPTSGTIRRRGRLAALLELGAGFHPDLTGRDNVYLNAAILGLTRAQTDARFDEIVEFSGIEKFIDTQVKFYSSGMYVRLAFAVAVHVDPDILLVDEVLAVGDEPFQRKCMDKIRAFQFEGRTIVLVSHALETVGDLCDRVVVMESGRVAYDGEPAAGLRILREGFASLHVDSGRGSIAFAAENEIESVALVDVATGAAPDVVHPGDTLRLEVTVHAGSRIEDWVVGMGIDTPLGHVVFGTNTRLLGNRSKALSGRKTISFELPDLRLGNGHYSMHASFGTRSNESAIRQEQVVSFDCDDASKNIGAVAVTASFSVA